MKKFVSFLYLITSAFGTLFATEVSSLDKIDPLKLHIEIGQKLEFTASNLVLVNVDNSNEKTVASNVRIILSSSNANLSERIIGNMLPKQSASEVFELGSNEANPYVSLVYEVDGVSRSEVRAIVRPPINQRESTIGAFIPAVVSLCAIIGTILGTFFGAYLLNRYSTKREESRANFEWSKMLFEQYEGAYRTFLHNWNGSISSQVLETQFQSLQASAWVPIQLNSQYDDLIVLFAKETSNENKIVAATKFRSEIERFMQKPWI